MKSSKTTRALIESAMMIALATVLSVLKIIEMPYGGSVTVASMLPIVILSYRQGIKWGLGGGVVYATIQQLLGLKNLSYFTTWQSVLAIILLDYLFAFALVGLAGIFRKGKLTQRTSLVFGAALTSALRYICHTVSGATVWAGLSIPDSAALIYSIGYNATYMLPESIILIATAFYLGNMIDFRKPVPDRLISKDESYSHGGRGIAGLCFLCGAIADTVLIAPSLQDEETGMFTLKNLASVSWIAVAIISVITLALGLFLIFKDRASIDK